MKLHKTLFATLLSLFYCSSFCMTGLSHIKQGLVVVATIVSTKNSELANIVTTSPGFDSNKRFLRRQNKKQYSNKQNSKQKNRASTNQIIKQPR